MDRIFANVSYYKNGDTEDEELITSILDLSGMGVASLNENYIYDIFKFNEGTEIIDDNYALLEPNDRSAQVVIAEVEEGVLEFLMEPSSIAAGMRTEVSLWNNSNKAKTMGVMYAHDTMLGNQQDYPNADRVPVYSLGANKGMYITNETGVRLNYTFERYRENPTNFVARNGPTETLLGFKPEKANGIGVESDANDAPKSILMNGDTGIAVKRSPTLVQPGERSFFAFTTGLGLATTNPEIIPRFDTYDIGLGSDLEVTGDWFDIEGKKDKQGVIGGHGIMETFRQ
ncbi:hypothetical protein [Vagococcus silagei]|uniref:Uncharacterized protein n=1 Tax=Vagococcus silagei TaxID=2508885 RepID=A0A4S3B7A1_9ENTE|nr:hypothetical protein [Vagococcus silagei]THB61910.1 hypothetical protein ESZ54_01505 [Vagococcus silagei]